jgi:hypothetical protein
MKALIITLGFLLATSLFAMSPALVPMAKKVDSCLASSGVLLCDASLADDLKKVDLNVRGAFVYFLKDKLTKVESVEVLNNLYTEFKPLIEIYEVLDGDDKWSCRDAKQFLGEIAVKMVRQTEVNSDFLVGLYKEQRAQSGRYGLLTTAHSKVKGLVELNEMRQMIEFAEFARSFSKEQGDEYYVYVYVV